MKLGLDILYEKMDFEGLAVQILAHRASVDSKGIHIMTRLQNMGANIRALIGPEHGFNTKAQDMEAVPDDSSRLRSNNKNIPVYSLYGDSLESLKPESEIFDGIDALIIDLQDIGARYYTYIYTMALCMQTAAKTKTKVIVLDRPNPIGGMEIEGSLIDKGFESFVGLYPLPNRHGMTIGELADYFNVRMGIGCNLEIVKMDGWQRSWYWDETGLDWTDPSPNMRSLDAAILYPGICLIEGTNISEGRGTQTPFEHIGAPFIDGGELEKSLTALNLPGVTFHKTSFTPEMQKWTGEKCEGVVFKVTDRKIFRSYLTGLALVHTLAKIEGFEWRREKYEFRSDVPAIDLLTGSCAFRESVDSGEALLKIKDGLTTTPTDFIEDRKKYLFY